jgi:hypothetical protein
MFLLFGLGLISPSGIAVNEYVSNENLPSSLDYFLLGFLFILGALSILHAYSIIYIKDLRDARNN